MADTKPPADEPVPTLEGAQGEVLNMDAYNLPLWKRVWRHSLTQMILLSVQAFCGPAMADAITGKPPHLVAPVS
jgi:hypothetical protein